MENRENLFKQYKKDWPQTVGETDKVFDNDNFIDWLCQQTKALTDEIEELKKRNEFLEQTNGYTELVQKTMEENERLKTKLSDEREYSSRRNDDIKALEEDNQQLQSRISELETKVIESIQPALKYFNGFDSPDQNEAAFHGLNNLNNYVTNKPKTN